MMNCYFLIKLLRKLNYSPFVHPQYSPHIFHERDWIQKGDRQTAKDEDAKDEDTNKLLPDKQVKYIQSAVGALLYFICSDGTALTTFSRSPLT